MKCKIYTKGGETMRIGIYPNLSAEQARFGKTDKATAELLGIHPRTYARRKEFGGFKESEITALLRTFDCTYEYLFTMNPPTH